MANLPKTPFTLQGGCFCRAVRYTITVPGLESRPIVPDAPKNPLGPQDEVTRRFPIVSLDHCDSCRRVAGGVLQVWFICPQAWISFSLLARSSSGDIGGEEVEAERISPASTVEVLVPAPELRERTYLGYFSTSQDVHRIFCGRCGTSFTYHYSGDDNDLGAGEDLVPEFDIALGTLDKESAEMEGMRPTRQGWIDDGIPWVKRMVGKGEWIGSSST